MQINTEKLASHCANTLLPIYIVGGQEPLLIAEACDIIRKSARKAGFENREVYHIDKQFDWSVISSSAQEMSLFGDKKLIEIRLDSSKPGDKGARALNKLCNQLSTDNLIIVQCGKLEKATKNSKWFKTIEKHGGSVVTWPIKSQQLVSWLHKRLQQNGFETSLDTANTLANRVEGNLLAAAQEIEKLKLRFDAGPISNEVILESVTDNTKYSIFTLIDHSIAGKTAKSLQMLSKARLEGIEIHVIAASFTRELRTLCHAAEALHNGDNVERILNHYRIFDSRKGLVSNAIRRLNHNKLKRCLALIQRIDAACKGYGQGDPWLGVQQLIVQLR